MSREPIAVLDFETTGMAPAQGARATELAIVLLQDGQVVDRFQSLMRTGVWIPPFITQLTGITNAMVDDAPPAEAVMRAAARFVGDAPLVAHNAAFDRSFWQAELRHAGLAAPQPFACTVLLSRRIYPDAPSHRLGRLAQHLGLPSTGRAHRALADAEMAAALLARMQQELCRRFALPHADHALLAQLQRCARRSLDAWLRAQAERLAATAAGAVDGLGSAVGEAPAPAAAAAALAAPACAPTAAGPAAGVQGPVGLAAAAGADTAAAAGTAATAAAAATATATAAASKGPGPGPGPELQKP